MGRSNWTTLSKTKEIGKWSKKWNNKIFYFVLFLDGNSHSIFEYWLEESSRLESTDDLGEKIWVAALEQMRGDVD